MSMHEIEDLVEGSIRVLDAHTSADDDRVRDAFAKLYAFQQEFDCGFTHLRVMDILLRRRFTYRFPREQHPDYAQQREFFDGLDEFAFLGPPKQAREAWNDDEFPIDTDNSDDEGYFDPPHVYCDAGSALWRRMVAVGRLSGADAAELRRPPLIEVVEQVVVAAEKADDRTLIAMWYGFGPHDLIAVPVLDELREMPALRHIREIVRRTDALSVELAYDHRPSDDLLELDEVAAWWFRLDD